MRSIKIIILLQVICTLAIGQNWQWARCSGGLNSDDGFVICLDQAGNSYVAESMQEPKCYFQADSFNISGLNDMFITKYDINGAEVWTKQFGGQNNNMINLKSEAISDMVYDSVSNSIYFMGSYILSSIFGSDTLSTAPDDCQIFFAKMDLNGNCLWAKQAGSTGDDSGNKLTIDLLGNIFIVGSIAGFGGSGYFDTIPIPSGGFIAKVDPSGYCQWVKHIFTNQGSNEEYSIASLKYYSNNLYMYGNATDTLTLDTMKLYAPNYHGKLLSKWDLNGNIEWAKRFGGPNYSVGGGKIGFDNNSNIYLSGVFIGPYGTFGTDTLYCTGISDMYIVKYDIAGNILWIKQTNASQSMTALGCYSDADGNIYLTGSIGGGNASFDSYTITATTNNDIFLARYNAIGDCLGVRNSGNGFGIDVISDATGSAYLTGKFYNTINFDSYILTSHGYADMFLAKINAITGIGGSGRIAYNKLIIYANPNQGKCDITVPDEFLNEQNLTLSIYNNNGKLIQQKAIEMIDGTIKLNLEAEAKGIYNVQLSNGVLTYSGKIVFE